jgi:hypothetical protein
MSSDENERALRWYMKTGSHSKPFPEKTVYHEGYKERRRLEAEAAHRSALRLAPLRDEGGKPTVPREEMFSGPSLFEAMRSAAAQRQEGPRAFPEVRPQRRDRDIEESTGQFIEMDRLAGQAPLAPGVYSPDRPHSMRSDAASDLYGDGAARNIGRRLADDDKRRARFDLAREGGGGEGTGWMGAEGLRRSSGEEPSRDGRAPPGHGPAPMDPDERAYWERMRREARDDAKDYRARSLDRHHGHEESDIKQLMDSMGLRTR